MVQKVPFTQTSGNTMTIGTGSSRVIMGADSGNLKIQDSDSNTSIIEAGKGIQNPSIVTIVANNASLPTSGLSAGDLAWSTANSHFFVSNGTGWYKMTIVNEAPTITLSTDAITLGSSGNTADITYTVVEPEGTSTTVTVSNSGIADTNTATITHTTANNTIRVTNTKAAEGTWSGTVTATVTDGVNLGTDSFTVSISYLDLSDTQDSYFKLSADGNNGVNSSFVDSSTTGTTHTITGAGNAMQGSFSPYSPTGYSTLFDGVSDYFNVAASGDFLIGTGDFTLEAWINLTSSSTDVFYRRVFMLDGPTGNSNGNLQLIISASTGGAQVFTNTSDLSIEGNIKVADDKWHHVAVVRSGTTVTLYVDGVADGTATYSGSMGTQNSSEPRPRIGSYDGSQGDFSGFIHDVRLVVGTAVYTAAFTPPTTALTAITNTKLLTCNKGYLQHAYDSSGRNHLQTKSGNVTTMPFSPYDVTDAYTASTHGGSVKLDGSGDYISVPTSTDFNFGTGDYTIEFWMYPTYLPSDGSNKALIDYRTTGTQNSANLWLHANGHIYLWFNGAYAISGDAGAIKINNWYHIALARSGSSTKLFINGIQEGSTYSDSNTYVQGGTFYIGKYFSNSSYDFAGYFSDVRVVKGTAVYTSTFTPPSSALTEITNTKLLLNMSNAKIYDEGGRFNLTLVNNTKSSTGQTRISGESSVIFDGSADSFQIENIGYRGTTGPENTQFFRYSEDYTIEGYLYYPNTPAKDNSVNPVIYNLDYEDADTKYDELYIDTDNNNYLKYINDNDGGTDFSYINNVTFVTGAWKHFAVVKKNDLLRVFYDGDPGTNDAVGHSRTTGYNKNISVGAYKATSGGINGYLADFRITKGVGKYPFDTFNQRQTLTTSTSLQSGITTTASNVKALLCHTSNKNTNGGTTPLASSLTAGSGVTASTFAPIGGMYSAYFDNSSNATILHYNHISSGTGVFTVEMWVWVDDSDAYAPLVGFVTSASDYATANSYRLFYVTGNNALSWWNTTDFAISSNNSITDKTWHHIAVTRASDNKIRLYIDGGNVGTSSSTFTEDMNNYTRIIFGRHASQYFKGYMSNVRLTNQVLYTQNFTPSSVAVGG